MASAIRPIGHEDRLSLVDHLDELRTRLIVSAAVLAVAFGFCLWQNHALLHILNKPLQTQTRKQVAKGQGTIGQAVLAQQAVLKLAGDTRAALEALQKPDSGLSPEARAQVPALIAAMKADVAKIPRHPTGDNPVTLGVGEPFTTTITVSLLFALVFSLPLILFQLYGFVLPALTPDERRAVMPLLGAVPVLFVIGVLFGYFVVLPAAVRFFVNFNASEFNVLVQASTFYKFAATILVAMGLVFQVPVVILATTRIGLVTVEQLRKNRRYAIVACAVVAAFLPGDAITLVLETVPLYLLYEASILVASLVGRRAAASTQGAGASPGNPAPTPDDAAEPSVQQIVDHVDPDHTS
ncbi:MAG TPA: twin-arginine translocase subunit TatC [Solirubrobacteraceae bacterium]|jgi:sec-independent protein translocase protein TatC|nr:twin-arginine translocase subunit TatC [Solirubrobacteraceae bacterium]